MGRKDAGNPPPQASSTMGLGNDSDCHLKGGPLKGVSSEHRQFCCGCCNPSPGWTLRGGASVWVLAPGESLSSTRLPAATGPPGWPWLMVAESSCHGMCELRAGDSR